MTHYLMYITSCHFIFPCLCIAMQLLVSFLYLYHACAILTSLSHTMLGRPFVVVVLGYFYVTTCHVITSDLSVSCFHLTHVYHLASSVLSPDHHACYYLARPFLLCHDLTWLLSILWYAWLFVKYHRLIMLSLDTKHDAPDFDIIITVKGM